MQISREEEERLYRLDDTNQDQLMTISQQWKGSQCCSYMYACMHDHTYLIFYFLGQDHCAILETQIEALCRQLQLYDLSESEGGDIDQSEDHGKGAEDDEEGSDEGEGGSGGSGDDDDIAGDDEQYVGPWDCLV